MVAFAVGPMSKKKKETREERGQRLQRVGAETCQRNLKHKLITILHARLDLVDMVQRHFVANGIMDSAGNIVEGVLTKTVGGEQGDTSSPGAPGKKNAINKNFTRPSNTPVVHLSSWLQRLEPSTFSEANIKSILVRGKNQQNITKLCEHLENAVGLDPDTPLFEDGRSEEDVENVIKDLVSLNFAMGRRARDVVLTVSYDEDYSIGNYDIK